MSSWHDDGQIRRNRYELIVRIDLVIFLALLTEPSDLHKPYYWVVFSPASLFIVVLTLSIIGGPNEYHCSSAGAISLPNLIVDFMMIPMTRG